MRHHETEDGRAIDALERLEPIDHPCRCRGVVSLGRDRRQFVDHSCFNPCLEPLPRLIRKLFASEFHDELSSFGRGLILSAHASQGAPAPVRCSNPFVLPPAGLPLVDYGLAEILYDARFNWSGRLFRLLDLITP